MAKVKVIGTVLYQWEVGRRLQITPISGMTITYVHFSHSGDKEALVVKPREVDGMIVADVPNILLQSGENLIVYTVNVSADRVETLRGFVFPVIKRPKPSDYVYTETEVLNYRTLAERIDQIEKNGVSDEQIATAVEKYLDENPIDTGVQFETDNTLILKDGVLSVNTTDQMEQDNILPMTSAGVAKAIKDSERKSKEVYQPKGDYLTEHQDISGKLEASELPTAINTALAQAKESGEFKGDPGEDGKDGYTPVKGVDYFDGQPGEKGEPGYTPQKGIDYFDGAAGKDGIGIINVKIQEV